MRLAETAAAAATENFFSTLDFENVDRETAGSQVLLREKKFRGEAGAFPSPKRCHSIERITSWWMEPVWRAALHLCL